MRETRVGLIRRLLAGSLSCLLVWLQGVPPSFAAEFSVFKKTSVRRTGAPVTETDTVSTLNPQTAWRLRATNGTPDGANRVSSAVSTLNGVPVLSPNQFNQQVSLIQVPVTLQTSNTIATELRSKPNSQLTIEILGTDDRPPSTSWHTPLPNAITNQASVPAQLRLADDIAGLDPLTLFILLDDVSVRGAFTALTQPVLAATLTATLAPNEGQHTLKVDVKDLAGQAASASVAFTVDRTPPAITNLSPTDGSTVNTPRPTISAGFTDSLSGVEVASVRVMLDGADVTAQATITASSMSFTPAANLADGTHIATFNVADRATNLATAQTTFHIVTGPPVTPQSGFIHGTVFHAVTEAPLVEASVTVQGVSGAVRTDAAGRFQFPTPGSGDFIVDVSKAGFTSVQRSVNVLETRDAAVAPAYLTPLDSQVTPITSAQGGVATDSTGTFEVTFPPGAAPRDLSVIITPLTDERQLPGPMKEGQGHIAAVYFEPRFTTFNTPATMRVRNTMGLPQGTTVNLQLWHEDAQQWQPEQSGQVTADGQWIEFRIVRFFCWYCVWLKRILPARTETPQQPTPTTSEAQDPGKGCEVRDQSAVCLASGRLSESHSLPSLRTLGTSRTLTFTYHFSTASPSVLLGTDDTLRTGASASPLIPATTSATIQIEGRLMTASFQGASGPLRQAVLWDGKNARGELVPTGAYPYTVALSNDYMGMPPRSAGRSL